MPSREDDGASGGTALRSLDGPRASGMVLDDTLTKWFEFEH